MTDGAGGIDRAGDVSAVPTLAGQIFSETHIAQDAGPVMAPIAEFIVRRAFDDIVPRLILLPDQRAVLRTVRSARARAADRPAIVSVVTIGAVDPA